MKAPQISKNHLLHNIDKCTTVSALYRIVQQYDIPVRMQTLGRASGAPAQGASPPGGGSDFLERLKKAVMEAVENSWSPDFPC